MIWVIIWGLRWRLRAEKYFHRRTGVPRSFFGRRKTLGKHGPWKKEVGRKLSPNVHIFLHLDHTAQAAATAVALETYFPVAASQQCVCLVVLEMSWTLNEGKRYIFAPPLVKHKHHLEENISEKKPHEQKHTKSQKKNTDASQAIVPCQNGKPKKISKPTRRTRSHQADQRTASGQNMVADIVYIRPKLVGHSRPLVDVVKAVFPPGPSHFLHFSRS